MKAVIYISGKIGEDTTLVDVIRQFKSFDSPEEVEVVISSIGGSVEEGEAIFNYIKALDVETPVTTVTDKAYSIAAKIFASGSTRIIEDSEKPLMIHFAWAEVKGDAERLEIVAEALREMEEDFTKFYSEFLDVDEETVRSLLGSATFVSGSEAVDLGFATEVKIAAQAVAEYRIENSKNKKMTEKAKKRNLGKKLLDAMAAFIDGTEVEINAELTLQDSSGTEILFPDLESGDVPKVGDKATIDGAAVPDGSYIMPSTEEATVVFVDGAITEVKEKEVEETAEEIQARLDAEAAAKKPEINAEEIKEVSVWSVDVINTSFALGDVVEYKGYDTEDSYPVCASEFQLSDGRRIVTDASGVIVKIKEADVQENITVDAEASFEEMLVKVTEKVTVKVKAELQAELSGKDDEIKLLKKQIGSKEFKAEEIEIEAGNGTKNKSLAEIFRSSRK